VASKATKKPTSMGRGGTITLERYENPLGNIWGC